MNKIIISILTLVFLNFNGITQEKKQTNMNKKVINSEEEWKAILTPKQYKILRKKGTDMPGDYGYTSTFEKGTYFCAACNAKLFKSNTKYDSHCGWPSFDDAIKDAVIYQEDLSHGMIRTEIICSKCGGHLGHIFDDGPKETTGKRYCVNSTSLSFKKSK